MNKPIEIQYVYKKQLSFTLMGAKALNQCEKIKQI